MEEVSKETLQFQKMTQTPVPKLVLELGIPTTISMLVTSIYNMADTFFIGKYGTSASGAVGVVFGLMAIIQAFGFMFGQGAGSIASRALGAKDVERASRYASTGFFAAVASGLFITGFGLIFLNPLCGFWEVRRRFCPMQGIMPFLSFWQRRLCAAAVC